MYVPSSPFHDHANIEHAGYQRTVLVLWPLKFDINKSFKDDIDDAIRVLLHVSIKAHKRE